MTALTNPEAASPFGARRYNAWNEHVKARYGGRVQKVSVIAGFSCPNRDGLVGSGGCTFCNNAGFTPGYLDRRQTIAEQIDAGLDFLHRRYPGISGLAIGTRPDCLPNEVLDCLAQLAGAYIIELEIGVESCNDAALARVNRGHDFAASVDAIRRSATRVSSRHCRFMRSRFISCSWCAAPHWRAAAVGRAVDARRPAPILQWQVAAIR